jgi:hypothetical protein
MKGEMGKWKIKMRSQSKNVLWNNILREQIMRMKTICTITKEHSKVDICLKFRIKYTSRTYHKKFNKIHNSQNHHLIEQ